MDDDSHYFGHGLSVDERVARECTYQDFMKCQPLYFKGTEGVVELTQWFERMETVFRISHCSVENQIKFSTCTLLAGALTWWNSHVRIGCVWLLQSEKVKRYVGGLPDMIHGSVVASKPKTMQEATEMATELMDKKISTLAERQAENKRKLDNNNQAQQQSPKRQNVARAYVAETGERKEYAGTLPLCNRCKLHHNGPCTVKCGNIESERAYTAGTGDRKEYARTLPLCNRNHAAARNQRTLTCYECGNPGLYRSDCLELKNQNHRNQAEGITLGRRSTLWQTGEAKPQVCGPSKVMEKFGSVAYKLEFPQELSKDPEARRQLSRPTRLIIMWKPC
ncbi:hypothetical protein Tco_1026795 [Tanacetum coccineum]